MSEVNQSKTRQIKSGCLLKYKKRIFKSNWRESVVTLYNNATIESRSANSSESSNKNASKANSSNCQIQMSTQTTLIVFGRQLLDLPKKPMLPTGYGMEQLLAIGLICNLDDGSSVYNTTERLSIIFHWFLTPSMQDLFEWIIAINGIIPANKQIFTDEELTMSLVMSEAAHYNNLKMLESSQSAKANQLTNQDGHTHDNAVHDQRNTIAHPEWTLAGADGATDGYLGADPTSGHYFVSEPMQSHAPLFADHGITSGGMDCSDFDDCSAYAGGDAFAVF